jgi:hypothetical protein
MSIEIQSNTAMSPKPPIGRIRHSTNMSRKAYIQWIEAAAESINETQASSRKFPNPQ